MSFNSHENAPRPGVIASAPITVPATPEPIGPSTWFAQALDTLKRRWVAVVSAVITLVVVGVIAAAAITLMNVKPDTTPVPLTVGASADPAEVEAKAVALFVGTAAGDGLNVANGTGKFDGFVVAFRDANANGTMDAAEPPVRGVTGRLPAASQPTAAPTAGK